MKLTEEDIEREVARMRRHLAGQPGLEDLVAKLRQELAVDSTERAVDGELHRILTAWIVDTLRQYRFPVAMAALASAAAEVMRLHGQTDVRPFTLGVEAALDIRERGFEDFVRKTFGPAADAILKARRA